MTQFKIFSIIKLYKKFYSQFHQYTKSDARLYFFCAVMILIVVITNTIMIFLMGEAINTITLRYDEKLHSMLIIFAVIVGVNQAVKMISAWLMNEMCLRFIGRCRNKLLSHSLSLSFPIISKMSKGDILARLSNEIDLLSQVIVNARLMMISHVLTLAIYISMLFLINTFLALIAITSIPLYLIHQRYFSPRKQRATQQFLDKNAQLLAYEEQSLSNLRGISSNSAERVIVDKHYIIFNLAKKYSMRERVLDIGFSVTFMLINFLVGLVIILIGVNSIQNDNLTVGALVSFILYLGYLSIPVRGIAELYLQCSSNTAAAYRVAEVFNTKPLTSDGKYMKKLYVHKGFIDFVGVKFSYDSEKVIFRDINLHLEANKTYALVGPSGSGKSSLINLLMRFYDPQEGSIKIDGVDIRTVSLTSLRDNIAVVWQDKFYMNGTIRENLLLACETATSNQLTDACIAADAWDFITQLPQQLDTRLGNLGTNLSGGQYQRLAIAQAFLKNAEIIVFDEASSSLDSYSEQQILLSIDKYFSNRTLLIIAHRFSSIQNANYVIYFYPDGRTIVGKHQELYENIENYREAVSWQTSLESA